MRIESRRRKALPACWRLRDFPADLACDYRLRLRLVFRIPGSARNIPDKKMTAPPLEYLTECFSYDEKTGVLRWKERPRKHFSTDRGWRCFNSNDAGNEAGTVTGNGYKVVTLNSRRRQVHRIIWMMAYKSWPALHIDHINGNSGDNRLENLRQATDAENLRNCRIHRDNKTGFKGIHFHKARGKYHAQIMVGGTKIHLGYFLTPEDAHAAYCTAADKYHGAFANHGEGETK